MWFVGAMSKVSRFITLSPYHAVHISERFWFVNYFTLKFNATHNGSFFEHDFIY